MARLPTGGRIDRTRPLRFTFDGRAYSGFAGDTLASALLANDVMLLGRSVKYHRPRGLVGAFDDEPNAILQVGTGRHADPNAKATRQDLYEGLEARPVNCWPSLRWDFGAVADRLSRILSAGFYYKTFMGFPGWPFYERLIRRAAGLGRLANAADDDLYLKRYAFCDVLVVGAGPAGLAAARAAAATGARVMLMDDQTEPGGSLLWDAATVDGQPGDVWAAQTATALAASGVVVLPRTSVLAYYDHDFLLAVERLADHEPPAQRAGKARQRVWQVRAKRVVLATGAMERPLPFPDNDRPGIMLASAARQFTVRYAAAPGRCGVLFTNNDSAYAAAQDLLTAGIRIAAVVDVRPAPGPAARALEAKGIRCLTGTAIVATQGRHRVKGVRVRPLAGGAEETIACDFVAMSGGWSPTAHLFSQSGGRLRWDDLLQGFRPDVSVQNERSVGAANGCFDLAAALREGHAAGSGDTPITLAAPQAIPQPPPAPPLPFWVTPQVKGRQWIDFQSDVTHKDVAQAASENMVSVEHLKRYTTTGMSSDQGKTSNVNALGLLGQVTGRPPGAVGTTRFRPPYVPVAMGALAAEAVGDLYAPRRTVPAHGVHRDLGAVFDDFGGWQRPDYYQRASESRDAAATREHSAVRTAVGLFESSPIGKIAVEGRDAGLFLQRLYANDILKLKDGQIRYGLMLNENGIIIDDGVCVRLAADRFLVSPTSGATPRILAWMEEWRQCEYPELDVEIFDLTTAWAAFAIAGPRARDTLRAAGTDIDLETAAFPHMTARHGQVAGVRARVMRVSFSGELQYEVQVPASEGASVWGALMAAGQAYGITPVGLEAWLRLRLEKGYVHVGSDTDGTSSPDDIGFGPALARKADDFVGRRSLTRPAMVAPDRFQLVGLRAGGAAPLPIGGCLHAGPSFAPPMALEGRVTSSCFSPVLNAPVALGLVRGGRARMGETLCVYHAGTTLQATICAPVFYDPSGERLRA
ncbi:sarcosine oxidase subunit alpha family protein [Azorhizobium sp. AG788]|uniref:sarcosine oxidase subunit alpha family protein n=1 Tax=Azorhizobium sp. AG788 TaxID=2183897 RepID=UPI003139C339